MKLVLAMVLAVTAAASMVQAHVLSRVLDSAKNIVSEIQHLVQNFDNLPNVMAPPAEPSNTEAFGMHTDLENEAKGDKKHLQLNPADFKYNEKKENDILKKSLVQNFDHLPNIINQPPAERLDTGTFGLYPFADLKNEETADKKHHEFNPADFKDNEKRLNDIFKKSAVQNFDKLQKIVATPTEPLDTAAVGLDPFIGLENETTGENKDLESILAGLKDNEKKKNNIFQNMAVKDFTDGKVHLGSAVHSAQPGNENIKTNEPKKLKNKRAIQDIELTEIPATVSEIPDLRTANEERKVARSLMQIVFKINCPEGKRVNEGKCTKVFT